MKELELIRHLDSPDPDLRQEAMLKISHSHQVELLGPLSEKATPDSPQLELLLCKYLQNIRLELALPHFLNLRQSPNTHTSQGVLAAFSQWDLEKNPALASTLLTHAAGDEALLLFLFKKIEPLKAEPLLPVIAGYLDAESGQVAEAAFILLAAWNFPSSIQWLLPWLKSGQTLRLVAAVNALGRISAFKQWKRLVPLLKADSAEVRQAAVQSIRLHGGKKAQKYLLRLLKTEKDEAVIKTLIPALAQAATPGSVRGLIRLAALHPVPAVRKTANWSLNECSRPVLKKSLLVLLKTKQESLSRYILSKIGEYRITELGDQIAAYLKPDKPDALRYAALEAFGLLGGKKYLASIRPYLASTDPLEAYLAVIAAAKCVCSLAECSELSALFRGNAPENEILKQTILEYMGSFLKWDVSDPSILAVLRDNLANPDINTRYLSLNLLKKVTDKNFIPVLAELAYHDPDPAVRDMAKQAINSILQGNTAYFFKQLNETGEPAARTGGLIELLSGLSWDQPSALEAVTLFEHPRLQQQPELLATIAEAVFPLCPQAVRAHILQGNPGSCWLFCLAKVWLQSLIPLNTEENKSHWLKLLEKNIPGLLKPLCERVMENRSQWAVEPLQAHLNRIDDPELKDYLKKTIKKILEL